MIKKIVNILNNYGYNLSILYSHKTENYMLVKLEKRNVISNIMIKEKNFEKFEYKVNIYLLDIYEKNYERIKI
jgi:hypothetical protein